MFNLQVDTCEEARVETTDPIDIYQFAINIGGCVSIVTHFNRFVQDSGRYELVIPLGAGLWETSKGLARMSYRFNAEQGTIESRLKRIDPGQLKRWTEKKRRKIAAKLIKLQDMRWSSFDVRTHLKFILGAPSSLPVRVEAG